MGLVQNAIEAAGISTISLTVQPHISKGVGVPRALYLRYPQGNLFGEPRQMERQREVLAAALRAVGLIRAPGTILEHPGRWRMRVPAAAQAAG